MKNRKSWIALFLVLGIVLLAPQIQKMRKASRLAASITNMRSINAAIKSHAADSSRLPTLFVGEYDNRQHSWRSTVQPYLTYTSNQKVSIDGLKPWDHPANAEARKACIPAFQSPGSGNSERKTRYLAFGGRSSVLRPGARGRKITEVTPFTESPPVLIEVPEEEAVHWMEPVEFDSAMLQRLKAKYPDKAFTVLFFDDSTKQMRLDEIEVLNGGPQPPAQPFVP